MGVLVLLAIGGIGWIVDIYTKQPILTILVLLAIIGLVVYITYLIKKNKKSKKSVVKTDNKICPLCGNQLVERNGKYGPFIGCSNFPSCRYISK